MSALHQPSFNRKEFWNEKLQRLKKIGGVGTVAARWPMVALDVAHHPGPIINQTAQLQPNYMIKTLQLPIHNIPHAFAGWATTEHGHGKN